MAERKPFSSYEDIALQAAVNEYGNSSWNDIPCLVPVLSMRTARGLKERWNALRNKTKKEDAKPWKDFQMEQQGSEKIVKIIADHEGNLIGMAQCTVLMLLISTVHIASRVLQHEPSDMKQHTF